MQTKSCPSCGTVVPAVAFRCKSCFHDFDERAGRSKGSPLLLLAALAFAGVATAGTFFALSQRHTDEQVLIQPATRNVQWVRTYADGRLETDNVSFDDVLGVKYVVSGADQTISVLTKGGQEKLVERTSDGSLASRAQSYAQMMGKPLEVINHNRALLDQASPSATTPAALGPDGR